MGSHEQQRRNFSPEDKLGSRAYLNVVPLQTLSSNELRDKISIQRETKNWQPWEIPLTRTYMLLRKPSDSASSSNPYPYAAVTLAGSVVEAGKNTMVQVLKLMSDEMHLHGIFGSDIKKLNPTPFQLTIDKPDGSKARLKQTAFSVKVSTDFQPAAVLCEKFPDSVFLAIDMTDITNPKATGIFDREALYFDGLEYRLPGNLRRSAKSRHQDGVKMAGSGAYLPLRELIMQELRAYEMEVRKKIIIEMLNLPEHYHEKSNFKPIDGFTRSWRLKCLTDYDLTDVDYMQFFQEYKKMINTDKLPQDYTETYQKLKTSHDFTLAFDHVQIEMSLIHNARSNIQGAYLQAGIRQPLSRFSPENLSLAKDERPHRRSDSPVSSEIYDGGPKLYADFLKFIFTATSTKNVKDLYRKLVEFRILKNKPGKTPEEYLRLRDIRETFYDAFFRIYSPDYDKRYADYPFATDRYSFFKAQCGHYSSLYNSFRGEISEHAPKGFKWALEQPLDVTNDQLFDHLLGALGINPSAVGAQMLPPDISFAYRWKILGIAQLMSETEPQALEEISADTGLFKNIVENLAQPGTGIDEGYLLMNPSSGKPYIVFKDDETSVERPDDKQVNIITTSIGGVTFRLAYTMRAKRVIDIERKMIERDHHVKDILDINGYTIIIDDSSIAQSFESENDKAVFTRNLVYKLESRIKALTEERGINYREREDHGHERKDMLDGNKPSGGSGASRCFRWLKKYIILNENEDAWSEPQIQEVGFFPDLQAAYDKFEDDKNRYPSERLAFGKIQPRIFDDKIVDYYSTVPVWQLVQPFTLPKSRRLYTDLIRSIKSLEELSRRVV